ncbi:HD domain-containing protein [Legionella hackeliae]|uniref:Predicted HD phosphohydrolase PhnZ n=1 Tax=Legionella hackeliae TaxID=449 RepID=A0A0A8UNZ7_LEGHA|nr:HD domain-containing protein [Legionella hackeliae]KTD13869.1 HD domain protein [Legionella hackeliae]CEK10570.1 Predicted HD phosphohydrolase PhnZ [Legionella hackeliae]STX47310.1 Predicted HD phosphohydrolase [Legionella hackeliae]
MSNYLENQITSALDCLMFAAKTDYIGEAVSQLEHALQCAYFAEQETHDSEVILASLFHDIGHFASQTQQNTMANLGIIYHEWIGAKLAYDLGFSAKVALLIGYHVDAKRYLAGKKTSYFERLSPASKGTLNFQGGVMSSEESEAFESHPYFKEILQVRVNDEKAKEKELVVPGLDYYRQHLTEHFKKSSKPYHYPNLPDYVDALWVAEFKCFLEKESAAIHVGA